MLGRSAIIGLGTISGTTTTPSFSVSLGREFLPPITFLGIWLEATVDLGHHPYVTVAELARDEFERGAGAGHPDGPVVSGIMESVALEAEGTDPRTMMVARVPSINAAEDTLT